MSEFFNNFFQMMSLRYQILFHYGSTKIPYILVKSICLLVFIVPFFVYGIFDFFLQLVLFIPSYLPLISIVARFICFISANIQALIFMLICLADIIFDSDNMQSIENLNTIEQ